MTVQKSIAKMPSDWQTLVESELEKGEGEVQAHTHAHGETVMRHLKIVLEEGYEDFAGILAVVASGENADIGVFNR
jgi:hypothetical protein